jgi:hypothetical protein
MGPTAVSFQRMSRTSRPESSYRLTGGCPDCALKYRDRLVVDEPLAASGCRPLSVVGRRASASMRRRLRFSVPAWCRHRRDAGEPGAAAVEHL